jgi:hypothetical protein
MSKLARMPKTQPMYNIKNITELTKLLQRKTNKVFQKQFPDLVTGQLVLKQHNLYHQTNIY